MNANQLKLTIFTVISPITDGLWPMLAALRIHTDKTASPQY